MHRAGKYKIPAISFFLASWVFFSILGPLGYFVNAQVGQEQPEWINISTIRYKGVDYIDSKWDATNVYAPASLQGYSDDQLDTACETFINVTNIQAIAFRATDNPDNVTGDISRSAQNAGVVEVHENTKGNNFRVNRADCSRDVAARDTQNTQNANKWFYESGDSMFLYFTSGGQSESEVIGEYVLLEGLGSDSETVYGFGPDGCKSTVTLIPGSSTASWTIRNNNSCENSDPDNKTKGTATVAVGTSDTAISPGAVGEIGEAGIINTTETCESTGVGLGWLICGILDGIDRTIGFVINSLVIDGLGIEFKQGDDVPDGASQVTAQSYQNTYLLWSTFRTIANIMFVIGFLVMIFGQTIGIDAYLIKKMAPRIAIAAILVQLSWLLSVEIVHWVNIIGGSIDTLLYAPFGGEPPLPPFLGGVGGGASFILFGGVTIAAMVGLIGTLALASTIALALIGAFATVIFRNILIFILLITSAIAAVLWILPNTERFTKMWWSWFIKALLVYPIIVGLIAVGKIASTIATEDSGSISSIIAVVVYFAPYFMIPFVFKFAGGAIASVNQLSQDYSKRGGSKVKEWEQPRVQQRKAQARRGELFGRQTKLGRFGNKVASGLVSNPLSTAGRITGTSLGGKSISRNLGAGMIEYNEMMGKLQANGISDDKVLNKMASTVMSVNDMEKQAKTWEEQAASVEATGDSKGAAEWRARASSMRAAKQFAGNNSASVAALLLNQSYGFADDEAIAGLNNSVADPGTRAQLLNYGGSLAKRGGRFDQGPNTYQLAPDGTIATGEEREKVYYNAAREKISRSEYRALPEIMRGAIEYESTGRVVAQGVRSGLPISLKGHEFTGQKPQSLKASREAYESILNGSSPELTGKSPEEATKIRQDVQTRLVSALGPYSNMDVKSQEIVREILEDGLDVDSSEIDRLVADSTRGSRGRGSVDPSTGLPWGDSGGDD